MRLKCVWKAGGIMREVLVNGWILGFDDQGGFGVADIELEQNFDLYNDMEGTVGVTVKVKEGKFYFPYYQKAEENMLKERMMLTKYEIIDLKLTKVNIGTEDLDYSVAREIHDAYFKKRHDH